MQPLLLLLLSLLPFFLPRYCPCSYIFLLGLLLGQYTIEGFDASAHMIEETKDAAMAGATGIVVAVGCSAVFGLCYILALLFSISVSGGRHA